MIKKVYSFCYIILFFFSCKSDKKSNNFAFYFWQSQMNLSEQEQRVIDKTNTIYIKYFDVTWQDKPRPVAKINIIKANLTRKKVIPVIYFTNEVFMNIDTIDIATLGENVYHLIHEITQANHVPIDSEIQIDCDWSDVSRDKYFRFLKHFKQISRNRISATIRLHQIKYFKQTGIPPIDKGVLMYYNMGRVGSQRNSIYNKKDASLYVKYVSDYPLQLNIALPIFRWGILYRNNKIVSLLSKITKKQLNNSPKVKYLSSNKFLFIEGMYMSGVYFQAGDIVMIEEINKATLLEAAQQIAPYVKKPAKVIFFDLDDNNLKYFLDEEFNKFAAFFN